MRIGFLNIRPPDYDNNISTVVLPSGPDYLAAYLRKYEEGIETFVEYDYLRLLSYKPDIIGISSFSRTYGMAIDISDKLKKISPAPIIIGGFHITSLPMTLGKNMDAGVIGEGERRILEIVKTFKKDSYLNHENLSKISGIVHRDKDGNLTKTLPGTLLNNLDDLPLPDRNMIPGVKGVWEHAVFASRGCPFTCKYCSITEFWENKIRYHSSEWVIKDLYNILSKLKVKENDTIGITIHDDLFGINKNILKKLVNAIREEKLHKKIAFSCTSRASIFDEEVCRLFLDMNMKSVVFGMESANDRLLKLMKGSSTVAKNQRALELCKKYNIKAVPNFVLGYPSETKEEASQTYWFLRKNLDKIAYFRVFPITPLPDTPLWKYGLEKNLITEKFDDWEALDFDFDPKRSLYFNEGYNKDEFVHILDEFNYLRNSLKDRIVFYNEQLEKKEYCENLFKSVSEFISEKFGKSKKLKILEITSFDESYIKTTSENFDPDSVSFSDINSIPPEKSENDLVILFHSVEMFSNPEVEINKLKNLLSDSGCILVISYNVKNFNFLLNLTASKLFYNSWDIRNNNLLNHFSINSLIKVFENLNFQFISSKDFHFSKNIIDPNIKKFLQIFEEITNNQNSYEKSFSYITLFQKLDNS